MTDAKKTQVVAKKGDAPTVSAPLIPLVSDALFNPAKKIDKLEAGQAAGAAAKVTDSKKDVPKKEDSKDAVPRKDVAKPDAAKADAAKAGSAKVEAVKPAGPVAPGGPTLEDLARQQLPTVAEEQAKAKKSQSSTIEAPTSAVTKDAEKTAQTAAANRLEEIAGQERLVRQQARSVEYRVPAGIGPQVAYQSNLQASDPASVYRPSNAAAPYTGNAQQQNELPQRGGVVTQYEHADLARKVGRSAADELVDKAREHLQGDKGLAGTYNRNIF